MQDKRRTESLNLPPLYTLTEVQGKIGVTHRTLLTYVKGGKLKATKICGKWRVTEDNLKAFLSGN